MLTPYRVLDCTDHRGHLAGLMLAQMGADVILVEPPGGSPARRLAPFDDNPGGPSLWHSAYNRGKRSSTLDIGGADRAAFDDLAGDADIVLLSGRPGQLPVDPRRLSERHPHLIVAVLSPFGLEGPKADWHETDLTVCASACQLALTGDTDRPPLRTAIPQGYNHGAGDLAVGAMLALVERGRSGRGQVVDVSAQASYLQSSFAYALNDAWQNAPLGRSGEGINVGAFKLRWGYPAADGEVSITLLFGAAFKEFTPNLFRWIWEEGECDEATRDKPWEELIVRLLDGREPVSELDRLAAIIARFTAKRTKAELVEGARARRVLLAPVATLREVVELDHLAARSFWDVVPVRAGGTAHRHPGRFLVASATPLRTLGPAPAPGQHDAEVRALSTRSSSSEPADSSLAPPAAVSAPASSPASAPSPESGDGRPAALEGLKVVDLTWSIAGPYVGRTLADFGATVVKIETQQRIDVARTVVPLHPLDKEHPLECGGLFSNCNAGKLGLELDLNTDAGREVLWDLLRWADVVIESFSAGAFERMGFGYERIAAVNPSVIVLSSCLPGQTGTLELPGYGNLSSAMFGFHFATRWPDRQAAGPFGAYTDTVAPRFALAGLLGAIDHRRRTGEGQYLDLSQAEASLHLLAPGLLDAEVNGRELVSLGNGDAQMAPHGVYPVVGDDRWVALACENDGAWAALAGAMGRGELAGLDTDDRLGRRAELDEVVAAWTATQAAGPLVERLQALGVASHEVQNTVECLADPQLAHRGHYVNIEHPFIGPVPIEGPRVKLSATPGRAERPAPTYGQHAFEILTELLGYDVDRVADVAAAGALG
ncbi:MAG: CoA transferase [Acidimicrobiia bacterium]|nr:CoA transferase [Acidimicrobiia bacterium]